MKTKHFLGLALSGAALIASCASAQEKREAQSIKAPRQVEKLGRGVVALSQGEGRVFVGWRLLAGDAPNLAFNVYRQSGTGAATKLNAQPLTGATHFVDERADSSRANSYSVRAVQGGREQTPSAAFTLPPGTTAKPYLSVALKTPAGYSPNDASVADLDGDGEYEIVLHQAGRARDNSQAGETDPPILQAYKLDGTLLWSINLGRNIRDGAHYTQFMVFDFDGDNRAEIVCKTADGTVDGAGVVIGDAAADHRNERGHVLKGPEFLSVFDGRTGKALATTNYIPGRYPDKTDPTNEELRATWGDGNANRSDRYLACVAYLDGVTPSVIMCRGYYTRTVLAAFDWRGGKLTNRWTFDSAAEGNRQFAGQGNHNLSVADVDNDGRDEIIYGGMTIDDNGKGLYSTRLGHGDAMHVSDLDPTRPGLEVFRIQERFDDAGVHMFDARTGEVLWRKASVLADTTGGDRGEGPGRGLALDIDPRFPGAECWAAGAGLSNQMWDAKGNPIGTATPSVNMGIYWDGDALSEILNGTDVGKWDFQAGKTNSLLDAAAFDCVSNNGTKSNPVLSADILGDWREEVIYRTRDGNELRIFSTTIPTQYRMPTLMSDPVYRLGIAWQNVAYNQPPHLSFDLASRLGARSTTQVAAR